MVKLLGGGGQAPAAPAAPDPDAQPPEFAIKLMKQGTALMPYVEEMTGLTRRELTLHATKAVMSKGGIEGFFNGLIGGAKVVQEPRGIRFLKTIAWYGPLFILLTGGTILALGFEYRLLMRLVGP